MRRKPVKLVVNDQVYKVTVYDTVNKCEDIVRLISGDTLPDTYAVIRKEKDGRCRRTYRMEPEKFRFLCEDIDIEFTD